MLGHNFHTKSQCIATQTLIPLHKHFLAGDQAGNVVASSFPIRRRSKQRKLRLGRHASNGVKAVLTSTEKSTSVKAVVTVLETVGGALTHLGLSRGLDDIADMLGKSLLVELVAAELDAGAAYTNDGNHVVLFYNTTRTTHMQVPIKLNVIPK